MLCAQKKGRGPKTCGGLCSLVVGLSSKKSQRACVGNEELERRITMRVAMLRLGRIVLRTILLPSA